MEDYLNEITLKQAVDDCTVEDGASHGIRKTDEDFGLECFCSDNPPNDDFERSIRGHIFDNNKLILKSIPYAISFTPEVENEILSLENYDITLMKEGSIIRVFFYKNKWFITTHRKLNAYKSKWGKQSFGEIFEKNIKNKFNKDLVEFCEDLNKNFSYIFLIGTTEETRFVSPQYDDVTLLLTMNKRGEKVIDENFTEHYTKKMSFKNFGEIKDYVENNIKYPFDESTGIFLSSKDLQGKSYKIFNSEYLRLYSLRNNLPSIMFAYLHNIFNEKNKQDFRKLYAKYTSEFDNYDKELVNIAKDLQKKYFNRFVKKQEFTVSKHEHNILYHIHKIYLETRTPITTEHVMQALQCDNVKITDINKIISMRKHMRKLAEKENENLQNN